MDTSGLEEEEIRVTKEMPLRTDLGHFDLDSMDEKQLALLQQQLIRLQMQVNSTLHEVVSHRLEYWWNRMPQEESTVIRLLVKGLQLSLPSLSKEASHLPVMLLADIENPDVVRLWAELNPAERRQRIEELRKLVESSQSQRSFSSREDERDALELAFHVLGLTPSASWNDIRKAYRELAAVYHPDKGGNAALFHALQTSYKLLEKRFC